MQISSKFTIALHMLICMYIFGNEDKITSEYMAGSINVNPVIIRNILQKLKQSKIVEVSRGVGGARIIKDLNKITLLDIYDSVESVPTKNIFSFHKNPNESCPLGKNIHKILDSKFDIIQNSLEKELKSITLKDVIEDATKIIADE